jgi:hypothetical protein
MHLGKISSLGSTVSFVDRSDPISDKPSRVSESISPGYTVIPFASTIVAPLGTFTEAAVPTAAIFPRSINTTPFSITPCVIVNSLPPVIAIVSGPGVISTIGACAKTPAKPKIKKPANIQIAADRSAKKFFSISSLPVRHHHLRRRQTRSHASRR